LKATPEQLEGALSQAVGAMGQVAITVNGRSYRFDCGDGEEPRLKELADYVKSRMETLTREHGNIGEERLLLMAALTIADELWDATDGNVDGDTSNNTADAKRRA
jgi:cell division protein ZapA